MEERPERYIGMIKEDIIMPGEAYIQFILDQLNGVSVHGAEDITRMLNAIRCLERLKDDIIAHKTPKEQTETETAENL